ncbi:MAG TPA: hypothetical protein VMU18_10855 [Rhodoblastus sp.]|nr:hypothetical protein [Rhodoblastus sp.]
MKPVFLVPVLAATAALAGCGLRQPSAERYAVILPPYVRAPQPSLRMAMRDCAAYDPFRSAYVDRLTTISEEELSIYARRGPPEHAACLRALGWTGF